MGEKKKILVCFKVTNELDTVLEEDWMQSQNGDVDLSYTRKMIGCYDEAALENGLRLADQMRQMGIEAEVTALTIGKDVQEGICKNLLAVGCDRVFVWKCEADLRFRPEETAFRIASFVRREGGFDVILMGQQASVGDHGKIHWMTGEYLSLPVATQVKEIFWQDGQIQAISEDEQWERRYGSSRPMICAMGNARYPYLRVATLREKMASSKKKITEIEEEDKVTGSRIREAEPVVFVRKKSVRNCRFIEGETAEEKARALWEHLKEEGSL